MNFPFLNKENAEKTINKLASLQLPFLLFVDFENKRTFIEPLDKINQKDVLFAVSDNFFEISNFEQTAPIYDFRLTKKPISITKYEKAFDFVKENLKLGNSFLTNLTAETTIKTSHSLEAIFRSAKAKYKLFYMNKWACFSPETFIQITAEGKISSFPMKGTIEKSLPNAEEILKNNPKEKHEHTTIVDLIRNDISRVAEKVWVERFRYTEEIVREDGTVLLQNSSEICGQLSQNWHTQLGTILFKLLPAGSISGAPKPKTIDIIKKAESELFIDGNRGFFTGIFGIFDGSQFDSAVMIRFIEQQENQLVFKSGGGITHQSDATSEYNELLSKIYVPIL